MAIITQNYDIDLKNTGQYPVVRVSQFDTGSREIVFTVYDGEELADISGCLARVDGTRSDGVEFSVSCTVGTGSRVSFTVTQEMTKSAGLHGAELVLFDASGNPVGTQNFMFDVEAAPMVRDAAASADDRTLYDQYTSSLESKFSTLSTSLTTELTEKTDALTKTVQDIDALLGGSSNAVTLINQDANGSAFPVHVNVVYDPISGMVACSVQAEAGIGGITSASSVDIKLVDIPTDYLPAEAEYSVHQYILGMDGYSSEGTTRDWGVKYWLNESGALNLTVLMPAGETSHIYPAGVSATWYARGGRYQGVTPIPTGSNTIAVGTTTTAVGGSEASVVNSGTSKDVVLDFTIPTQSFKGAGANSVAISSDGTANVDKDTTYGIAIGTGATAGTAKQSIPFTGSIAIGHNAKAETTGSGGNTGGGIAIGYDSLIAGNGIAIGNHAGVEYNSAKTTGVAIGNSSHCTSNSSVAIGDGAVSLGNMEFSVGKDEDTKRRRIINVETPTKDHDAATKKYVDKTTALVAALTERVTTLETKVAALEAASTSTTSTTDSSSSSSK